MKVLTNIKKENGTSYVLLPQQIATQLGVNGDTKILCEFTKYNPIFMKQCQDAKDNNKKIELTYHSKNKSVVVGEVTEYSQEYVIVFIKDTDESKRVLYSLLSEITILEKPIEVKEVKDGN